MMSHLPQALLTDLTNLAVEVDDSLQSKAHAVPTAVSASPDFDQGWVEKGLRRALLAPSVLAVEQDAFRIELLTNGGCEIVSFHDSVERRFRWRQASLDRDGFLVVKSNSDSILTHAARHSTLFDSLNGGPPQTVQQWVLAYAFDLSSGGLRFLYAGWVSGTRNEKPPYTLTFVDVVPIELAIPMPPTFPTDEDDLEVGEDEDVGNDGDEEEGYNEEAG